jgi:hypothetical protein
MILKNLAAAKQQLESIRAQLGTDVQFHRVRVELDAAISRAIDAYWELELAQKSEAFNPRDTQRS